MRQILSVRNSRTLKTFILPETSVGECSVVVYQKDFWLEEDIQLKFISDGNSWNCIPSDSYKLDNYRAKKTKAGASDFGIVTSDGERLSLEIHRQEKVIYPLKKYKLESLHRIVISNYADADIKIAGGGDQKYLCRMRRIWNGWDIRSEGEDSIYLNNIALKDRTVLKFGDAVRFGSFCIIFLGNEIAVGSYNEDVAVSPKWNPVINEEFSIHFDSSVAENAMAFDSQYDYYQPSARVLPKIITESVAVEEIETQESEDRKSTVQIVGQSILMVSPMLIGAVFVILASKASGAKSSMMMYASSVMAIGSAVACSLISLIGVKRQSILLKKNEEHRFLAYSEYINEKVNHIKGLYENNQNALNQIYPRTDECLSYDVSNGKLFSRTTSQSDFMKIRIGVGNVSSQITVETARERFLLNKDEFSDVPRYIKENYETLYNAPVLLDLLKSRLIGIVGGQDNKGAVDLARVISLQIAANHSYSDVKMVYLYDGACSEDHGEWDFANYLPHVFSEDRKVRMIASCAEEIGEIAYFLSEIFRMRVEKAKEDFSSNGKSQFPHYVVLLSSPKLLEGQLLAHYLFDEAITCGITTIILSPEVVGLPNSCQYVIYNNSDFRGIIDNTGSEQLQQTVIFDAVDRASLESFAKDICSVHIVEHNQRTGVIPNAVSYLDMYRVRHIEELNIAQRWRTNKVYDSLKALIGVGVGNSNVYLDAHEKFHGPHGLIAGTTGSGKSETLQTYLLSLAVEYSPDDVTFFIIDYKGGGMSNLFAGLPHLSGTISNLSGSQVRRAMVAINSENRRRQRLFNDAGVNNISKYGKLYKAGKVKTPIPHLFIVIDEFAELKREEPEFMKDLVSVAQIGRSIGVHLILSTQKPNGTVDDNIWSNSKFRLCLAVQTKEDSHDMLGKNDAAYITLPGRCYMQVGNDELYMQFQSGYSGAHYDPIDRGRQNATRSISLTGSEEIVAGVREGIEKKSNEEITQMEAVCKYVEKLCKDEGYAPVHKLWLPVLSSKIVLDGIKEYQSRVLLRNKEWKRCEEFELKAHVGMVDDPANQEQFPLEIDLVNGGHHGIIGMTQTGKSTFIQTIIYSLANRYSPEYLNFYCIDFSSRALEAFEDLKHVGGVMFEDDDDKIERFFYMMSQMLEERKKEFRGGNFVQYYRTNGLKYPAIVIAIDNYGAFDLKTQGKYFDTILSLAKEGESCGIYLILTAAGFSMNEIPLRLSGNIKTCYCLSLKDKYAYSDYIHTSRFDVLPENGIQGRGIFNCDGRVLEYQVAIANDAPDDYSRIQGIKSECEKINEMFESYVSKSIPIIPQNPLWSRFKTVYPIDDADDGIIPLGYDNISAGKFAISLENKYCYLISGNKKSERNNLIKILMDVLAQKSSNVVYISKDKMVKKGSDTNILFLNDVNVIYEYFKNTLTERMAASSKFKEKLMDEGIDEEEILVRMHREFESVYIVIKDFEEFADIISEDTYDISGFLQHVFKKGADNGVYFFGAMAPSDSQMMYNNLWMAEFCKYRTGIHLGANPGDDSLLDFKYLKYNNTSSKNGDTMIGYISEGLDEETVKNCVVIPKFDCDL